MGKARWTLIALVALAAALLALPAQAAPLALRLAFPTARPASAPTTFVAVPTQVAAPAQSSAESDAALQSSVLSEINAVRRAHGLVPVRLSRPLGQAALGHTRAMATYGFFAHESRDGTPFWKRIARSYTAKGFRYWTVGETLLFSEGGLGGAAAVRTWMNSPPHRRVLLSANWREIGIAAVTAHAAPGDFEGLDVTLVTADFGVRR